MPEPENIEEAVETQSEEKSETSKKRLSLWWPRSKKERILTVAGALVALLLILFAIPYTRYGMLGQVFKRDIVVAVQDSRTHKPVSDVEVKIGAKKAKTDAKGEAKVAGVPVGGWEVATDKKYYNLLTAKIKVPLFGTTRPYKLEMVAIGNQVTIKATNKITGKVLAKASIAVLGTTATTDANGEATLVLPVGKDKEPGTVKADGYNDLPMNVTNSETASPANTFALVPSGKIYFLSKRTGKINVMKSDLDGSNATVVIAGTGREDEFNTVLLSTRDWKYLALKARRDSDKAKLYLIDTSTDKLSLIDEGNVEFIPIGWDDGYFVYNVIRADIQYWQPKQQALKSFNAKTRSLKTLQETQAEGPGSYDYAYESFGSVALLKDSLSFVTWWSSYSYGVTRPRLNGKSASIIVMKPNGDQRRSLKDFGENESSAVTINGLLYQPGEVLYQVNAGNEKAVFYEYEDGKLAVSTDTNPDIFSRFYPTYIESPSGERTFWYEPRDGKNTIFSGDVEGKGEKQLTSLSEYAPYGWYTDDYILVSKKGSELYVAPADFSTEPAKVTDYHKPNFNGSGYGGGYGGN